MTSTQGAAQQVAHSMTTEGTTPFRDNPPPGDPFRGGAPSHGKVNVMYMVAGLILGLRPANERQRYFVTMSLIGLAQAYNQPCGSNVVSGSRVKTSSQCYSLDHDWPGSSRLACLLDCNWPSSSRLACLQQGPFNTGELRQIEASGRWVHVPHKC